MINEYVFHQGVPKKFYLLRPLMPWQVTRCRSVMTFMVYFLFIEGIGCGQAMIDLLYFMSMHLINRYPNCMQRPLWRNWMCYTKVHMYAGAASVNTALKQVVSQLVMIRWRLYGRKPKEIWKLWNNGAKALLLTNMIHENKISIAKVTTMQHCSRCCTMLRWVPHFPPSKGTTSSKT